ncbi:hypothetical protein NDU88_004718 [Pleurodeles waltl]|uniref:Uncharacterized protein n=1 Tax=Pleurodeles waltl TaxID=8319 RepID=A0AAV7SJK1_PLEWA|nr:hypothetical protein NDU88_004718 [Pleurodeles waltl]
MRRRGRPPGHGATAVVEESGAYLQCCLKEVWCGGPRPTNRPETPRRPDIGGLQSGRGRKEKVCRAIAGWAARAAARCRPGGASKRAQPLSNWWSIGLDGAQSDLRVDLLLVSVLVARS